MELTSNGSLTDHVKINDTVTTDAAIENLTKEVKSIKKQLRNIKIAIAIVAIDPDDGDDGRSERAYRFV